MCICNVHYGFYISHKKAVLSCDWLKYGLLRPDWSAQVMVVRCKKGAVLISTVIMALSATNKGKNDFYY